MVNQDGSLLPIHHGIRLENSSDHARVSSAFPHGCKAKGGTPCTVLPYCKCEQALERISKRHLDSPVFCGWGKDNIGCWAA